MTDFSKIQITTDSRGEAKVETPEPAKKVRLSDSMTLAEIDALLARKRKERADG